MAGGTTLWDRLKRGVPILVIVPSIIASFVYVFVFAGWTMYISLSDSTLLPSYGFKGWDNYAELWNNRRWGVAYSNLFFFSAFYVTTAMAFGLMLALLIDQKVRAESFWRTIFLYPLAVSFIVTGTVWQWLYNPASGLQFMVNSWGWTDFKFALTTDRQNAIWAIIITGIWQSAGFSMALFLAGLRSVDQDIIKAASIDGASTFRTYRKVILPAITPIFLAVAVGLLQFASQTYTPALPCTDAGLGIFASSQAVSGYESRAMRRPICVGAAPSMTTLSTLAVFLVSYSLYLVWRPRRETGRG